MLAELEEEGTRLGDTYRANKRTRAALTAEMANLNSDLKLAARVERDLGIQQQRLAATQARLDELVRTSGGNQPERVTASRRCKHNLLMTVFSNS